MNQFGAQNRFEDRPADVPETSETESPEARLASSPKPARPSAPTQAAPSAAPRRPVLKRVLPTVIMLLLAGAMTLYGVKFMLDRQAFVQETDARIVADEVLISSQVAGRIVAFPITEGSRVKKGMVLARLDDRVARSRIAELQAQQATIIAQKARIGAEISMADAATAQGLRSAQSKRDAARALYDSFNAEFKFARQEYGRAKALARKGVIARQKLDQARTGFLKAQQALLRGRAAIASADADLGAAQAARGKMDVLRGDAAVLEAKAGEIRVLLQRQRNDLADRIVISPMAGVISRTFANPGEFVNPGQRIALLHNTSDIWIEARVKETEFRRLRLGQTVDIFIDAYPDQTFSGKVSRLGQATTAEFALLPTPNPSGNFTKVTQRIPIRVAIAQEFGKNGLGMLRPGMMVEIKIHATKP